METFYKKVSLIGNTQVGKTCIVSQTVYGTFSNQLPTVSVSHENYEYIKGNQKIQFSIWDTAGQEQYRSLLPLYWTNADAILLCFDLTDIDSFNSLEEWMKTIHSRKEDCVLILIGNKLDLSDKIVIEQSKADDFASRYGIAGYFQVSA